MDAASHSRFLAVEGVVNARDLGGLARVDGTMTPYGVFFRSGNLDAVTQTGWEQLHAAGIRTVIDLRQSSERERVHYQAPGWVQVEQVDHDGLDDHPEFWADYWETGLVGTALYYRPHLERLPERSAAVLSALARAREGGVLFHCVSGRDRTGIIAMLLLAAAAVDRESIVGDYLISVHNRARLGPGHGRPDQEAEC